MNKLYMVVLCLGLSPLCGNAQSSWEFGLFGGWSNYKGDLQQSQFELDEMQSAWGLFLKHNFNDYIALRTHYLKGSITGSDANYTSLLVARERNLHFRSDIRELGLQAEISFMKFGENDTKVAAPYFFGGIAVFNFNPQAKFDGYWHDLQPLGTEGQGLSNYENLEKYELTQFAVPFGAGFNITLGKNATLGFEIGFRKTFTDYLDDVSGVYPDVELLKLENSTAGSLSYRSGEITGENMPNPVGQARGTNPGNDMYGFGGIFLGFKF